MTEKSRRVLVVEDDEGIREALVDLLDSEGFSVTSAIHGADALERLRAASELPDAIRSTHDARARRLGLPRRAAQRPEIVGYSRGRDHRLAQRRPDRAVAQGVPQEAD